MAACSEKAGYVVEQMFSLLDLEGVTMKKLTDGHGIDYIKAISQIDQLAYPEILGKMVIINAPGYFSGAWRLIRPFLDERTVSKVKHLKHLFYS